MPGGRSERDAPASAGGVRAPGRPAAMAARHSNGSERCAQASRRARVRSAPARKHAKQMAWRAQMWPLDLRAGTWLFAMVKCLKKRRLRAQHRSSSRRALICACRRRWSSTLYLSGPRRPPGRAARRSGFEPAARAAARRGISRSPKSNCRASEPSNRAALGRVIRLPSRSRNTVFRPR